MRRGKAVFDAVEHWVAETGRQPDGGTFHDAADGILRLTRRQNKTLHPLARRVGNGRERLRRHGAEQLVGRVEREGFVVLRSHGGKVRADKHAVPRKDLLGDAAELAPTFAEYSFALARTGCAVARYTLSEKNDFAPDGGILDFLRETRPEEIGRASCRERV